MGVPMLKSLDALRNLKNGGPRLFRIPFVPGTFGYDPRGGAKLPGSLMFGTRLDVKVLDRARGNRVLDELRLGSGLVTTAGVNLLAADWTNTTATLKLANNHDSGTGTTAASIADTGLQTPVVSTNSSTAVGSTGSHTITVGNGTNIVVGQVLGIDVGTGYEAVTVSAVSGTSVTATFAKTHSGTYTVIAVRQGGTQSNPSSGVYQSLATINYYENLSITEWGIFTDISAATTLWDHKVFSVLSVSSTISLQFAYQLTVNAGG